MGAAAALLAALAALVVAGVALGQVVRLRRALERQGRVALGTNEELLKDAWLEEIEARGEAVLARIAAAEESLRRWLEQAAAGAVRENPHGRPVGTADAKPLGQAEMSGAPGRAPTAPVKGTAFAKAAQVRELAEQGLDATAIARRLGIGRGEVELILRLPKPDRG
ncbi:MAG: hypothetical protein DIU82_06230 [Bacillota bacterium]|nr:MAG: hypothetical protein DIU82_06230 [Bacillota bacterium]